jgi:hypothetical protein
MHLAGSGVHA